MKQFIKSVLPRPVLNEAVKARDWLTVTALPRQPFAAAHLRPAADVSFDRIFSDSAIFAAWEDDHAAIKAVYGDDDSMEGVNPGDRRALYYLVMALKPVNVLEVGTHIGASAIHIARALKRLGRGGKVTSVDILDVNHPADAPWKKMGLKNSPRGFAETLCCGGQIDFRVGPCLDLMKAEQRRFDLVFLDGDHAAKAVYQEVSAALPVLSDGGSILLHDYYPGARPLYPDNGVIGGPFFAMERIRRENPAISVLPLGALPWATKQGTNFTTLALVAR